MKKIAAAVIAFCFFLTILNITVLSIVVLIINNNVNKQKSDVLYAIEQSDIERNNQLNEVSLSLIFFENKLSEAIKEQGANNASR